ncbi:MAG: 4Fe-4S dicluster domain-containing protein [Ruminococcaceae bacterium]|nr:4Fe-4S dicluster domain-containing protein [Oscillospiraceae bacterium]
MDICKSAKCTGCGACVDACPKSCISFRYDENGFYRSYVDEDRCIQCRRCVKVCPANHPYKTHRIQQAYKARRQDKQAAVNSSSGGIASVLSEYIVKNGGVVAGCGFDDTLCLKHTLASTLDELEPFKGSKYLQSNTVGIYRQVREQLQADKTVLFIGTPCQVSALQTYLGKTYDKLYSVDFVCHGVSSRCIFDKYLAFTDPTTAPLSVSFRNKTRGYRNKKACFEMQVVYPDRTVRNSTESGLYYWFASSLSVRESCYRCPFVSFERASDITLADYIGDDLDDTDNEVGVNTLFVNSAKGKALAEAVRQEIVLEPKPVEDTAKRFNRLMYPSSMPTCRKEFFDRLQTDDYPTLEATFDAQKILPGKMVRRWQAMKRRLRKLFVG